LTGAADLILKVTRGAEGEASRATVEAAKDDVDGTVLAFRLRVVELVSDAASEARKTCIADEADAGDRLGKPLGGVAQIALRWLLDLMAMEGVALPAGPGYPPRLRGVPITRWRQECEARSLSAAEDQKDRARVFRKASADLRATGRVAMRDAWVWTTREGQPDA
jgi:hypothetical protein